MNAITHSRLTELLAYDANTGDFTWRVSRQKVVCGAKAGSGDGRGYIRIGVCGRTYLAHKLAWFYSFGKWPDNDLDHIDRNRSNNRIANLREATRAQNMANSKTTSASGKRGVVLSRNGKRWRAQITVKRKVKYIGTFDSEEDAAFAYACEAARYFGEFATTDI